MLTELDSDHRRFRRFPPGGAEAEAIDSRVREGLAESLRVVIEALDEPLPVSTGTVEAFLLGLRDGPVSPELFALYTDAVEALAAGESARGVGLIAAALEIPPPRATFKIATLTDADLGVGNAERYARLINDDDAITLLPIPNGQKAAAAGVLAEALELMSRATPDYAAEISALMRQFVFVGHRSRASDSCFGSATSFYLWGAVVIDTSCAQDRLDLAVTLVHEAAHAHLFGATLGASLVEGGDDRYKSPLRSDPRPMEGIFHATFVLARIIHWLETALSSGVIPPGQRPIFDDNLQQARRDYREGRSTIAAHGKLTPKAKLLLAGADQHALHEGALIDLP